MRERLFVLASQRSLDRLWWIVGELAGPRSQHCVRTWKLPDPLAGRAPDQRPGASRRGSWASALAASPTYPVWEIRLHEPDSIRSDRGVAVVNHLGGQQRVRERDKAWEFKPPDPAVPTSA
jgi:hypothetical protein